jgi:hypothetical protein
MLNFKNKIKSLLPEKTRNSLTDFMYFIRSLTYLKKRFNYYKLRSMMNFKQKDLNITCEDLFIVTSCTNPFDTNLSFNYNTSLNQTQRAAELFKTLESIRQFYPNAFIVLLENSRVDKIFEDKIIKMTDWYRNYSKDDLILFSRSFINAKGVPATIKILKFLNEEGCGIHAKRIFGLVGRYVITKKLFENYSERGLYCRYYPEHNNVAMRHTMFKNVSIQEMISMFDKSLKSIVLGRSQEDIIHRKTTFPIHLVHEVGITGKVNGQQEIYE